jgi:uncharacterized membrane protein
MVIMALDHTRDYFHWYSFLYSPEDPNKTTLAIFFTRWVTHFCAPAFSFLAGISAFMVGKKKTAGELSAFLLKRGLWLVFIELTILNFGWYFDIRFRSPSLIVIWSLGISMIVLAALIHLPRKFILIFSCLVIFGHDLFDQIHFKSYWWAIVHDGGFFEYANGYHLSVGYPIVPWIAVMSLGYYFGGFYNTTFDGAKRKKYFNIIGIVSLILFVVIRAWNHYGDPFPWQHYDTMTKGFISFINPNKYPPSLLYLLMTFGVTFLFLANSEKLKGRVVEFFSTFGRVPFFYYVLHLYLIHLLALVGAQVAGFGWQKMILPDWAPFVSDLKGYGFGLIVVYAVWVLVIAILYPACKKFDEYKRNNKSKWWLSYW